MKTTLDLPDPLVRELQQRAHQAGQELAQAVVELLWKGLAASPGTTTSPSRAMIQKHATTGLPYVDCAHSASPGTEMTPDRVADVLLRQEATWQDEAGR